MDFIMTAPVKPRFFWKGSGVKHGLDNHTGLDSLFLTQSKRQRFLDLLAAQRAKNGPAQFHGIDLSHVDLSNIDLSGVDLTGANLTSANLSGAKLIGTNLTKAKLIRTILCNANLTDVILADIVVDRITQLSLQQASNQQWYEAAQQSIDDFNQKWEKLKSIDGFNAFETVLKRLMANNVTTNEIVEVIESVIRSPEIRRLVFIAAQGADAGCYAHLLTIFNTAQVLARFDKLQSENAPQQEILALAKGMIRQNLLDETTLPVMRHQWSEGRRTCNGEGTGPDVAEALKVQLALRHQLATQLRLPFPIKKPVNSVDVAELNSSDKEFVVDLINKCMKDKDDLIDALIALPIWQLYLERILGKKVAWSDLDEAEQIAMETLLRAETEKVVEQMA
jgi:hypothetical protein